MSLFPILGIAFIGLGVYVSLASRKVSFWANISEPTQREKQVNLILSIIAIVEGFLLCLLSFLGEFWFNIGIGTAVTTILSTVGTGVLFANRTYKRGVVELIIATQLIYFGLVAVFIMVHSYLA